MSVYLGKTVAFIPVRGGSKSIPLKNIKLLNNRPLVYWTLDAAVNCQEIDIVVVSTDNEKIKEVVEQYDSSKIKTINRSNETSTDTATTESAMIEFALEYEFENIILVQATSPLLTSGDLDKGLQKYYHRDIDSVLSVVRQKRFIWAEKAGKAHPVNYSINIRPRRQEFDGFLVENGAFYITSREKLLSSKNRISGEIMLVEMAEDTYFEIDEPTDWVIAEDLLKRRTKNITDRKVLQNIKCVLSDVDGVLTDGGMYYADSGDEMKKFNTKDGMGFALLQNMGIVTGIITGESVKLLKRRAEKMSLDEVYIGITDKLQVLDEICEKYNFKYEEIAYIGDDINDLEVIERVGLGCVVRDGNKYVKEVANLLLKSKGGEGALRELTDLIKSAKQFD